jgi:hypothetical protein
MRTPFKTAILGALGITLLGVFFTSTASAQCAFPGWKKAGSSGDRLWQEVRPGSGSIVLAAEGSDDRIVGFWKVKFVSEGTPGIPDETVIDNGLAQWHSDGTEIMNSSRVPATGNFCLGVFRKSGPADYDLNHFGLSFDPSGNFVGPARIREHVTLNQKADAYEGGFTIDQYDPAGGLIIHISGKVTATRITVDTPVADVL